MIIVTTHSVFLYLPPSRALMIHPILFLLSHVSAGRMKVDEFGNTNRPYQPLNGRDVYFVKA